MWYLKDLSDFDVLHDTWSILDAIPVEWIAGLKLLRSFAGFLWIHRMVWCRPCQNRKRNSRLFITRVAITNPVYTSPIYILTKLKASKRIRSAFPFYCETPTQLSFNCMLFAPSSVSLVSCCRLWRWQSCRRHRSHKFRHAHTVISATFLLVSRRKRHCVVWSHIAQSQTRMPWLHQKLTEICKAGATLVHFGLRHSYSVMYLSSSEGCFFPWSAATDSFRIYALPASKYGINTRWVRRQIRCMFVKAEPLGWKRRICPVPWSRAKMRCRCACTDCIGSTGRFDQITFYQLSVSWRASFFLD